LEVPKITVVIPVKNSERTIRKCLEAVLNQSIKPYEVIVVDGHSSDKTVEIAKRFNVRVIYENHGTVGGARQVGLEASNGDYVAFTDADCIPEKRWLENLVKEFSDEVVGVGGGLKYFGEGLWDSSIALAMNTLVGSGNSVQGRLFKKRRFVKSISGCNCMYRKETLLKIGGFNVNLSINEDTELNRRLSKLGKLLYVPDAIVIHYHGRGLKGFAKRMYQFGYMRGKLKLWDIQVIPPVVGLLLLFSLLYTPWILSISLAVYLLILFTMGVKFMLKTNDPKYIGSIIIVYIIEHLFYSIGFLRGLFASKHEKN
jgi:glycosyltransferase involved in cell wall biosynthesis